MLKNNFGLKKLGFGGARTSAPTRLASAIQDPSATNGLVSGGNWATGITSGVKGFLTGLGAMKDLQNERAYEQDMEQKYKDQLAIEAADKAQEQANWQATFDQNKADAERNYNLAIKKLEQAEQNKGNTWNTDLGNVYRIINDPNTTEDQKKFLLNALMYNKDPELVETLSTSKTRGQKKAELDTAQEIERKKALGRELLEETPEGGVAPIAGSKEAIARETEQAKKEENINQALTGAQTMLSDVDDALTFLDKAGMATGVSGMALGKLPFTDAGILAAKIDTIKNNVALNKLLEIKRGGGTLGALSEKELESLQYSLGKLSVSMPKVELERNLKKVQQHYSNLINSLEKDAKQGNKAAVSFFGSAQQSRPENKEVLEQFNQKYGL